MGEIFSDGYRYNKLTTIDGFEMEIPVEAIDSTIVNWIAVGFTSDVIDFLIWVTAMFSSLFVLILRRRNGV